MKKLTKSRLLGILGMLFAAWIAWKAGDIPMLLVSNEPGPRLFPYISAAGIFVCSLLTMIFDGNKEAKEAEEKGIRPFLGKTGWIKVGIVFACCIAFALSMQYLGMWITAMAGLFGFVWLLKGDKKVNVWGLLIFSIAFGSLIYFGFTRGFMIPLPKGELWELLGIKML